MLRLGFCLLTWNPTTSCPVADRVSSSKCSPPYLSCIVTIIAVDRSTQVTGLQILVNYWHRHILQHRPAGPFRLKHNGANQRRRVNCGGHVKYPAAGAGIFPESAFGSGCLWIFTRIQDVRVPSTQSDQSGGIKRILELLLGF